MIFCTNEPCETEALYYYVTDKGVRFHLCFTCMEAFQLGQANADKYMYGIDDEPDDEDDPGFSTCNICGISEESVQSCPDYYDRPLCSKCAAMYGTGEEEDDGEDEL